MYVASRSPRSAVDLVVELVELARRAPRSAPAVRRLSGFSDSSERPLGGHRLWSLLALSQLDLDGPLGRVDAGADDLALVARRPCRCAGRAAGRSRACRRTCGRCPRGSRTAARARPPRRPRGSASPPSHSASQSLFRNTIVPPSPSSTSPPSLGWKRSMCRRSQSPCALPVLARARRASRPGPRRTPRARASPGTARRGRPGVMRPLLAGELLVQPEAVVLVRQRAQLVAEDHVVRRWRAECR